MEIYSINRLSNDSQSFVFSLRGTAKSRSDAFSLSLASMLISRLKINFSNNDIYFDTKYKVLIVDQLNKINGVLRINVDSTLDYCNKLFLHRYSSADNCLFGINIISSDTAVADFFGISRYFSQKDIEMIKNEYSDIQVYTNKINNLLNELDIKVSDFTKESE